VFGGVHPGFPLFSSCRLSPNSSETFLNVYDEFSFLKFSLETLVPAFKISNPFFY